jgi:hypothetical protein
MKLIIITMKNSDEGKEEGKEQKKTRNFLFFPLILVILCFLSVFVYFTFFSGLIAHL